MMLLSVANIGRIRLALGVLLLAGYALAAWFAALGYPLVYVVFVALSAFWIWLWTVEEARPERRLLVASVVSLTVCVVQVVVGVVVTRMKLGDYDEGGPLFYAGFDSRALESAGCGSLDPVGRDRYPFSPFVSTAR